MTKLEKIAAKARAGEELTEEEMEYVAELVMKLSDLGEKLIEWLRPVVIQTAAIILEAAKKIEEKQT